MGVTNVMHTSHVERVNMFYARLLLMYPVNKESTFSLSYKTYLSYITNGQLLHNQIIQMYIKLNWNRCIIDHWKYILCSNFFCCQYMNTVGRKGIFFILMKRVRYDLWHAVQYQVSRSCELINNQGQIYLNSDSNKLILSIYN